MKYRVIFLSALDIWSMGDGRGAPSFYNTIKLYLDQGHDVTLIKPTSVSRNESQMDGLKVLTYENGFLERMNQIRKISFFSRIASSNKMTRSFYRIAEQILQQSHEPCLLYAYEVHAVKAVKRLSLKYHVPLITRFQGTILKDYEDTPLNRLKKYPHFSALAEESDLIIMTDDGTLGNEQLRRMNNPTREIRFWKNGVGKYSKELQTEAQPEQKAELGCADTDYVLLTVSRLTAWKRLDRAIDALADVIQSIPNCKLIIVGDGDIRGNLERFVQEKGLEGKVIFAGAVTQGEVSVYYQIADVFLSLYDIGNVGNPLLEALLYGKPIITLDNGDTKSVIQDGENGILLPVNQPELISKSIIQLLKDEEMRKGFSERASAYAKENLWTWNQRMEAEYKLVSNMVEHYYQYGNENHK